MEGVNLERLLVNIKDDAEPRIDTKFYLQFLNMVVVNDEHFDPKLTKYSIFHLFFPTFILYFLNGFAFLDFRTKLLVANLHP